MFHIYKEDASDRAKSAFEGEVVSSDREIVRELVGEHVFENLGAPVPPKPPQPTFMTTSESGQNRFWVYQRAPGHYKIFGLDIETGQAVTLDMAEHVADSNAHICMFPYQDRYLYIWAGRHPGRFFRYEIASGALTPLGDGFADMAYVLGYAVEDTERMFIGAYPSTRVASVDFGRDTVRDWGRLAEDERQMYIIGPVVGGDGMLYCPVGLHHGELYAVNLRSGEKKQIIPEGWEGKIPVVWALEDGTVWGRMGERRFRCRADGVDLIDKDNEPGYAELRGSGWQYKSPWPYRNGDAFRAGAWRFLQIQSRGGADRLVLEHADTKERHGVALDTTVSAGGQVYSIGDVFGGRIYGGTISPSQTFSYDPSNNTFRYYPRFFGGGRIQVYDILRLPGGGMLQSSYTNAALDWFDPSSPEVLGENPRVVARLAASDEQERIFYLRHGPDGQVYFGTTPVKGLLGGALGRYRPDDHSVRLWRDILPDQSIRDATAVPETGEVFGAGSISGGTSAIPSETEADVFLWDCAKEKVAWTGKPIAGATDYLRVVRAPNGHLVGIARTPAASVYYVFDPRNRETLFTGELASGPGRLPHVCDNPLPTGEIIGSSGNAIYAIDAGTGKMRILVEHPSLGHLHGMEYHDGWLYYGSLSHIWRVKL